MSTLFYTQIDDSPVGPLLLAGDQTRCTCSRSAVADLRARAKSTPTGSRM